MNDTPSSDRCPSCADKQEAFALELPLSIAEQRKQRDRETKQAYRKAHREKDRESCRLYYAANREKARERNKANYAANREKRIANQQRYARRRKYGLTEAEYHSMLAKQGGRCLICKTQFGITRQLEPCIDHCHKEGHVRGILCRECNAMLGHARDDARLLFRAARYIEEYAFVDTEAHP